MKYVFRVLCLCAMLVVLQSASSTSEHEEECAYIKDICDYIVDYWYVNQILDIMILYNMHTAECESNYLACQARKPFWFKCKIGKMICYGQARKLKRLLLAYSHDEYEDAKDACEDMFNECKEDPLWFEETTLASIRED